MKVAYVAGPYRAANPDGTQNAFRIQQNIMAALFQALEVWKLGHAALCPHANTMFFQHAAPDAVFLDGDIELLRRCDCIVTIPGWERSSGARHEVKVAQEELKIPVFHTVAEFAEWAQA